MKNIAVIFGGKSVENNVSIITAHNPIIESLLATKKYNVIPIYISKTGKWYSDDQMNDISYFKEEDFESKIERTLMPITLSIGDGLKIIHLGGRGFGIFDLRNFTSKIATKFSDLKSFSDLFKLSKTASNLIGIGKNKIIKIDLVFPAMHGTYGEDGSLMGLLRMAGVPFIGCDMATSAIAMDKVLTKQILKNGGLPVVKDVWFLKDDFLKNKEKYITEINKLKYPLFVKPVHLGSSIGISKVENERDLINAIELAFHYDEKVLVEEGVQNLIELTLPIMGNEDLKLALVEKPLNKNDFFDFNEKYLSDPKKTGGVNNNYSEIPANIDKELMEKVKELGIKTYKTLGCSGIARVDFLVDYLVGEIFVNEVNTLPGSLYQHNWKKAGISNIDLVEKLIDLAEEKFKNNLNINYGFQSNILTKYNKGSKQG